jgi:hypothetical protein
MSQVISDFLALREAVQCQILEAALAGRSYTPSTARAEKVVGDYWSGLNGNVTGTESMFLFRVNSASGYEYTIHKELHTYLNRLFIGFDVSLFEATPDRGGPRSVELQELLRGASVAGKTEVEISGVLKCEALARLLRYGMMTVDGPIELDRGNPFKGSLIFRISKKMSDSERKAESARVLKDADDLAKSVEALVGT